MVENQWTSHWSWTVESCSVFQYFFFCIKLVIVLSVSLEKHWLRCLVCSRSHMEHIAAHTVNAHSISCGSLFSAFLTVGALWWWQVFPPFLAAVLFFLSFLSGFWKKKHINNWIKYIIANILRSCCQLKMGYFDETLTWLVHNVLSWCLYFNPI